MNDPMPSYWKPPRSGYARYVPALLVLLVVALIITAAIVSGHQAPAGGGACQQTRVTR